MGSVVPMRIRHTDQGRQGSDVLVRYYYGLDDLRQLEDERLNGLFDYWMSRHDGDRIPSKDDVDPVDLAKLGMIGTVHILDVAPDNPAHFFYRLYGSKMTLDNGKNYTGLRIGDYPVEILSAALQEDYLTVKYTGAPRYQHVGAFVNNSTRGYTRLTLPLASDGYKIDKLLIGVKFQKIEIPPRLV